MRALLIEDNKFVSDSIRTMLVPAEYEVDTVAFGEYGLATAKRGGHDVIILDLMLPDIDGHDVLCRMRREGVESPILILTGLEEAENKARCLDNGADDFLTKPLDRMGFLSRLEGLTQGGREAVSPSDDGGRLAVNFDTNTFLIMHR